MPLPKTGDTQTPDSTTLIIGEKMAFWELLGALARRWPIVLLGAIVTVLAAWGVVSDEGAYLTRTEIVFLAPTSDANPNALRTQSEDVIVVAGLVAKRMTGAGEVTKFASPEVTLIGLGARDGWMIRLQDTGGQWATNFASQRLVLDIVGPTEAAVRADQDELTRRVDEELLALQRERGVEPVNDIVAIVAPESTVIYHVGGSRVRALGMTALLGAGATLATVVVVEHRRRRPAPGGRVGAGTAPVLAGRVR